MDTEGQIQSLKCAMEYDIKLKRLQQFIKILSKDAFSQNEFPKALKEVISQFKSSDEQLPYLSLEDFENLREILKLEITVPIRFFQSHYDGWAFHQGLSLFINLTHLSITIHSDNINSQNSSFSQIVDSISQLKNLECLKLLIAENYSLYEEANDDLALLGTAFQKLSHLKSFSLVIKKNRIGQQGSSLIGQSFVNMEQLQKLNIEFYQNQIQENGMGEFCSGLNVLKQLVSLKLIIHENQIRDSGCEAILKALSYFSKLEKLKLALHENKIGSYGFEAFGNTFSKLHKLKRFYLHIGQNAIGEQGAKSIGEGLSSLKALSKLTLKIDGNKIRAQGAQFLSLSLVTLANLKTLFLKISSQNYIKNEGFTFFGYSLGGLLKLQKLHFSIAEDEKVTATGCTGLAQALPTLINLKGLVLEFNEHKIEKEGINLISSSISKLQSLTKLDFLFGYTLLQSTGQLDLGSGISNLTALTKLTINIGCNQLQIEGAINLGKSFMSLINLISLYLVIGSNQIQAEGAVGISEGLKILTNLKTMTLEINEGNSILFQGSRAIGESLKSMINLNSLTLSFGQNKIGSFGMEGIAEGLKDLKTLETLSLTFYENNVFQDGFSSLGESLKHLSQLLKFYLFISNHELDSASMTQLSQGFKELKSVQTIQFMIGEDNKVTQEGLFDFFKNINQMSQLENLSFTLQGKKKFEKNPILADSIVANIKELKKLKQLQIKIHQMNNLIFLDLIEALPQLKSQCLQLNYLNQIQFKRINQSENEDQISKVSILELQIDLSNAYIKLHPSVLNWGQHSFAYLKKLTIDFRSNFLGQEALKKIVTNIVQFQSLTYLVVSLNNRTSEFINYLQHGIENKDALPNLEHFYIISSQELRSISFQDIQIFPKSRKLATVSLQILNQDLHQWDDQNKLNFIYFLFNNIPKSIKFFEYHIHSYSLLNSDIQKLTRKFKHLVNYVNLTTLPQ